MGDVTRILSSMEQGDRQAAEELLPLVYAELRRLAQAKLAQEAPGQTLQPTALVHEAYLRLVLGGRREAADEKRQWEGRGHFFVAAAEAMRRILIENARRKKSEKHGGHLVRQELDVCDPAAADLPHDVLALDEALQKFAQAEPRAAELVKLRYFAGLSLDQAASVLGVSPRTADSDWAYARAWLWEELRGAEG